MRGWPKAFILISVLIPTLAWAEIYYWVDDQGTQYFTTRFESIPEPYRSQVNTLSLPTLPPAPPELQSSTLQQGPTKIPYTPGSPIMVSARINGAGPITLIL